MNSLFRSKSLRVRKETLIKESLLSQLSNTIKEIQLLNSKKNEIFSVSEATNTLVIILESIFLHGLKLGFLKSAMMSSTVGGVEDTKPQPSFWTFVSYYTHKDTISSITSLSNVTSDVGKSRAWIRLVLNQSELTSYIQAMSKDRKKVNSCYYDYSFIRDRDTCDTALQLLEGMLMVQFNIPTNSSLLNTWSNEPLMLSGIWSPSLRSTPIYSGVDIAEGLEDEVETYSMTTASSMSSLVGILALDEKQVLKMILDTPTSQSNTQSIPISLTVNSELKLTESQQKSPPSLVSSSLSSSPSSTPLLDKTDEREELEEQEQVAGNSLINKTGWSSSVNYQQQSNDDKPFTNLLESYGSPMKTNDYKTMLSKIEKKQEIDEKSDSDYEVITPDFHIKNFQELNKYLTIIPQEIGLNSQKYICHTCQLSIGLNFAEFRLCYFTKKYYCVNCHVNQLSLIPSRIIYNWDHKKYPVSIESYNFIQKICDDPIFDMKKINVKLYSASQEMKDINLIRLQLNLLRAYLYTCKKPVIEEFQKKIWPREYLYEQIHAYSLNDLSKVPGSVLANELSPLIKFARDHVLSCWLCSQKGFVCEICKNPKVIYPFDCSSTYRCNKCHSVYHGECLKSVKHCRKCERKQKRMSRDSE